MEKGPDVRVPNAFTRGAARLIARVRLGPTATAHYRFAAGLLRLLDGFAFFPRTTVLPVCFLMNFSVASWASGSGSCSGGDFIRYALGPVRVPAIPWFRANLQRRTASITMPAEFGESQT